MGLLGYLDGGGGSSSDDSGHGLTDSEEEPRGGAGALRGQIATQAAEILELQDRLQDLLEKVGGWEWGWRVVIRRLS
jgi:hypothetical protein